VTRILIADDHPIIVSGLKAVLDGTRYEVVAAVATGEEVIPAAERLDPDFAAEAASGPSCCSRRRSTTRP
jgi:DNA-binding NarL/FixJ family response regulator